jgi:23S rRNA (guanine745-N1)-methyltransferase
MVAARDAFLREGHYATIAEAVQRAVHEALGSRAAAQGCVVDLGAGTGYYLARLLGDLPAWVGVALDSSRHALRHAARASDRVGAVACDVWQPLPLRDGCADVVLNVFAPRNGAEIARILATDGALVVVTPTPRHLASLVAELGLLSVHPDKPERLRASLAPALASVARVEVEVPLDLSHEDVRALVGMGPSAHHVVPAELEASLARLPGRVTATASVAVETFRRA